VFLILPFPPFQLASRLFSDLTLPFASGRHVPGYSFGWVPKLGRGAIDALFSSEIAPLVNSRPSSSTRSVPFLHRTLRASKQKRHVEETPCRNSPSHPFPFYRLLPLPSPPFRFRLPLIRSSPTLFFRVPSESLRATLPKKFCLTPSSFPLSSGPSLFLL